MASTVTLSKIRISQPKNKSPKKWDGAEIKDFQLQELRSDGTWRTALRARAAKQKSAQEFALFYTVTARYVKLKIESNYGYPHVTLKEIRFFGCLEYRELLRKLRTLFDSGAAGIVVSNGQLLTTPWAAGGTSVGPAGPSQGLLARLMGLPATLFDAVLDFLRSTGPLATSGGDVVNGDINDDIRRGRRDVFSDDFDILYEFANFIMNPIHHADLVDGLWHVDFRDYGDDVVLMCRECGFPKPLACAAYPYRGAFNGDFSATHVVPPAQPRYLCERCMAPQTASQPQEADDPRGPAGDWFNIPS